MKGLAQGCTVERNSTGTGPFPESSGSNQGQRKGFRVVKGYHLLGEEEGRPRNLGEAEGGGMVKGTGGCWGQR